jgi:hypothetical protein
VAFAFGHFHDAVKVHQLLVEPLWIAPQHRDGVVGARVQLTLGQSGIDLLRRVAGDELRIL